MSPDFDTWRCPQGHKQIDVMGTMAVTPDPPHAGFCPECGPTIVELKHDCTMPQDASVFPWTCDVCGVQWELEANVTDTTGGGSG